ncbi:MAG TPA: hypothetical protein VGO31_10235 [Microbacteriaceae bacterium]|nr:hypothetical protein [Microbacteriaceae bacterium]
MANGSISIPILEADASPRRRPTRRSNAYGSTGPVNGLRASMQGDRVFMRRVNCWLRFFGIAMIPISLATGWVKSVVYVSALSPSALVSGTGRPGRPLASR